jgi:hypothetical protein
VEATGEYPGPLVLQLLVEDVDRVVPRLYLVSRGRRLALDHVDRQQILLHDLLLSIGNGGVPILH